MTGSQNQVLQRVTRKGAHSFTKKSSRESTLKAARSHKISVEDDCVIFILDSFKSRNYAVLSRNLKDYICKEAFDKLNITVDKQRIITKQVDVPQQNNFCDCGVYLIHYVERFLLDPARIVELMAKVMKNMETNNREIVNELLRLWDTSMISKKRGKLKSEIVMCKTKQDKERDAEREPSNQQQQQQQREQNERQDPQELQKQQSQDQQPESQPQTSSLQGQPSATPSQNNSDEASSYDMSLDAVDIEIGNSSNSIVQEKIPNDDYDEDEVVVVDVMKKSRRGPRRGKR